MSNIDISKLLVIHQLKDAAGHGMPAEEAARAATRGLFIDTCLRQLCIGLQPATRPANTEVLRGAAAYTFLLQTITGLNSSVPGETNIQGQFRCAWKRWRKTAPADITIAIDELMAMLLTDSKQIRRRYLQNLGGASYGTLTRKLLKPAAGSRILFTGSGNFAQSMLPMFAHWETALWNHRLHPGLQTDARIFAPADTEAAAAWASHIILTTPPEDSLDLPWVELITKHEVSHVAHLGRRRAERGCWNNLPDASTIYDLDDIFDLRRRQTTLRDLHTLRARRACERIARHKHVEPTVIGTLLPQGA